MGKFINPFTDEGFKRIFGQEVSKELLIDFLNNLLEGERHITDVKFLDKEQLRETDLDRGLIYDVYCETDTGEYVIVEMQNRSQSHFKERALLYLSKAIVSQSKKGGEGESYEISAVYGVFFMNFRESRFPAQFRTDVALMDMKSKETFSDKLRMIFLQLPEFKKEAEECENYFERWIYVLKNMEILNRMPWAAQHAAFQRLATICETAALTPAERDRYEASMKVYRDNIAIATRAVEEGMEKGIEKGMEKANLQNAQKMKAKGFSIDDIMEVTGLSKEQIEQL
ncbi:MAG: Rpn family recombination-promoting nuclease/putative transposase [Bacteroidaceae bacterium]|nr:Rpn family recombination-promoting nuclease/putative transposase [Bacteroidaceae bacterium]